MDITWTKAKPGDEMYDAEKPTFTAEVNGKTVWVCREGKGSWTYGSDHLYGSTDTKTGAKDLAVAHSY